MSHLFKPNRESMSWIILYDFQVMKKFLYSKRIMQYILSYIKDVLRINSTALWILYGWRFIMCAQIEVTTVLHIIVVIVSRPWHANASNFTDFIICEYQHLHMSTILVFFCNDLSLSFFFLLLPPTDDENSSVRPVSWGCFSFKRVLHNIFGVRAFSCAGESNGRLQMYRRLLPI